MTSGHQAVMNCSICTSSETSLEQEILYDDRYGYPGLFSIYRCAVCGHIFLCGNAFTPEFLSRLYSEYYPRSSYEIASHAPAPEVRGFRSWLNGERGRAYCWVPERVRVLDIGCGFGETLGYHAARGCDVYGVEADENIRRVAERFGYKVHVGLFDADVYEPEFFDYVTLDQVIEHVNNPIEALQGVAKVLNKNGTIILSMPNANGWGARVFGRRWINWHAPYHVQFFSKRSMELLAEQAGLRVERSFCLTSSEWLNFQWTHLLTFPEPGRPSSFWSPKIEPSTSVVCGMGLLRRLHRTGINHVITRLFDMLGMGDSMIFFMRKK